VSRRQRRAQVAIARSAKWKAEQARLAKLAQHQQAALIDRELPGEPKIVSAPAEAAPEEPPALLEDMAAAIRARKP